MVQAGNEPRDSLKGIHKGWLGVIPSFPSENRGGAPPVLSFPRAERGHLSSNETRSQGAEVFVVNGDAQYSKALSAGFLQALSHDGAPKTGVFLASPGKKRRKRKTIQTRFPQTTLICLPLWVKRAGGSSRATFRLLAGLA